MINERKPSSKKSVEKSGQSTKIGTTIPGETTSIPEISSQTGEKSIHTNSLLEHLWYYLNYLL